MFGRPIEGDRVCWWGARAIYNGSSPYYIDIVPNRRSSDGKDEPGFYEWLNKRALPWLRNEVARIGLSTTDERVLVFEEGVYRLEACTNRSYGYLYIGAVRRLGAASSEPVKPIEPEERCESCDKVKTPRMRAFEYMGERHGHCCASCCRAIRNRRAKARHASRVGWGGGLY
jgi:hypothetical protein